MNTFAPALPIPVNQRERLAAFVELAYLALHPHRTVPDAIAVPYHWRIRWFGSGPPACAFFNAMRSALLDELCGGVWTRPCAGREGVGKAYRMKPGLRDAISAWCLDLRPLLYDLHGKEPPRTRRAAPPPPVPTAPPATSLPELPTRIPVDIEQLKRCAIALVGHIRAYQTGTPAPDTLRRSVEELATKERARHPGNEQRVIDVLTDRLFELCRVIDRAEDRDNPHSGTVVVVYEQRSTGRHYASETAAGDHAINPQTMTRFVRKMVFAGCWLVDIRSAQPTIALACARRLDIPCGALWRLVAEVDDERAYFDQIIAGPGSPVIEGLAKQATTALLFGAEFPNRESAFAIEKAAHRDGVHPRVAMVRDIGAAAVARLLADPKFRRLLADRDAISTALIADAKRVTIDGHVHLSNAAGMTRLEPAGKRDRRRAVAFLLQGFESRLLAGMIHAAEMTSFHGGGGPLVVLHDAVVFTPPCTEQVGRRMVEHIEEDLACDLGHEVRCTVDVLDPG